MDPLAISARPGLLLPGPRVRLLVERVADDGAVTLAVEQQPDGSERPRRVGELVLRAPGDGGDREIGYRIEPEARGRGLAAEAVQVAAAWAFGNGVQRLRLGCGVENLASVRTAMRAGFLFEGVGRGAVVSSPGEPVRRGQLARFARLAADPPVPVAPAFADLPPGGLDDGALRLRPLEPGDADALVECDDEVSVAWGFTGTALTPDDARDRAARAGLDRLVGGIARLAMVDVASGRVAGTLDLRLEGPPQVGGIGYAVHPDFRGRGYTVRALRLVVDWAFSAGGFARLELGAKAGNTASIRSAERAGFLPDGVRRARLRTPSGGFDDEICFVVLAPGLPDA